MSANHFACEVCGELNENCAPFVAPLEILEKLLPDDQEFDEDDTGVKMVCMGCRLSVIGLIKQRIGLCGAH